MQPDAFQTFLRAVPMPAVSIGADERIVAMNDGGVVLLGQQALHCNHVTMVRQPSILETIEATLADGKDRHAKFQYISDNIETVFDVSCRSAELGPKPEDTIRSPFEIRRHFNADHVEGSPHVDRPTLYTRCGRRTSTARSAGL